MGETSLVFRLVQGVASFVWANYVTNKLFLLLYLTSKTCKDDDHLASLLGFVSDHCVVMNLQVPREALEFAGMSINFRSGKFGYSICPIFSKGNAQIFCEF